MIQIMVKTETITQKTTEMQPLSQASPCVDCIFWYRCRGGKLDCLFRAPLSMTESVRA
ncbi:MAG: hypothetical protein A4E28_03202 [Methanocella sp. PtaU1.Bin125]|nr:MAG: hypothetical protein A4E28_03202 [Methanocella sp. PtaU1.Bin125]